MENNMTIPTSLNFKHQELICVPTLIELLQKVDDKHETACKILYIVLNIFLVLIPFVVDWIITICNRLSISNRVEKISEQAKNLVDECHNYRSNIEKCKDGRSEKYIPTQQEIIQKCLNKRGLSDNDDQNFLGIENIQEEIEKIQKLIEDDYIVSDMIENVNRISKQVCFYQMTIELFIERYNKILNEEPIGNNKIDERFKNSAPILIDNSSGDYRKRKHSDDGALTFNNDVENEDDDVENEDDDDDIFVMEE